MITPQEIRQQLEKWWPEVLAAGLTGVALFPKSLTRVGKVKKQDRLSNFDVIRASQDLLIRHAKGAKANGYTIHWEARNYRDVGKNQFIAGISIDSLEDYLTITAKSGIYVRVMSDAASICKEIPQLTNWCESHATEIERFHHEWPDLLRVVSWFLLQHSPHQYYIRELPIPIPTKFVESHKAILTSLLDAVLPPDCIYSEKRGTAAFEERYGLKIRQPLVRMRILDANLANSAMSGVSDLSIPLDEFQQLKLPVRRVIILENKTNYSNLMNFLTLPQMDATLGLFGSGFSVGRLKDVSWLKAVELFYWGDIDAHGLQILSQLRGYFPHVRPLCMDSHTLDVFREYVTHDAPHSPVGALPHLTEAEQALFDYLNSAMLRLEQEHVSLSYVKSWLQQLIQ